LTYQEVMGHKQSYSGICYLKENQKYSVHFCNGFLLLTSLPRNNSVEAKIIDMVKFIKSVTLDVDRDQFIV